jgi:hypothetical protein
MADWGPWPVNVSPCSTLSPVLPSWTACRAAHLAWTVHSSWRMTLRNPLLTYLHPMHYPNIGREEVCSEIDFPWPVRTQLHDKIDATLHYTTLHYTTLHYTTLHYTTLHYTTRHYTTGSVNGRLFLGRFHWSSESVPGNRTWRKSGPRGHRLQRNEGDPPLSEGCVHLSLCSMLRREDEGSSFGSRIRHCFDQTRNDECH